MSREEDYNWPEESLDAIVDHDGVWCGYCGTEVEEGERTCPRCGTRI